jgi:hypothetical protein
MTPPTITVLAEKFKEQFPNLPVGGFYNPTVESEDDTHIAFRCYYDNYDNEENSWRWTYDKGTGKFFS